MEFAPAGYIVVKAVELTSSMSPLLRVVDFSTHLSGPMASHLLVELGADVIKVENARSGDGNRAFPPLIEGEGLFHVALNGGTRSLAIDVRSPHWPEVVAACARWADVVIVGARPSDARSRGLDFSSLRTLNDRLVYCSISGYGINGPWSSLPAHGLNVDAFAGLVPIEWRGDQPSPREDYHTAGTTLAGVFTALGALAAVRQRELEGAPQYVHVSIWGAAMWWNWRNLTSFANLGEPWTPYKDLGSRYAMYGTSDSRALLVCPIEEKFWSSFCELLELPREWKHRGDWSGGVELGGSFDDEKPQIARAIAHRSLEEWVSVFLKANIPFAPVIDWREALGSEQAEATGLMRVINIRGKAAKIPTPPVEISAEEIRTSPHRPQHRPAPRLGEHTAEVLEELGLAHLSSALVSGESERV